MKSSLAALFVIFVFGACTSKDATKPAPSSPGIAGQIIDQTQDGFGEAAMAPLEDVNLRRERIPDELTAINSPYDVSTTITCAEIETEVQMLNDILGRDWDVPPPEKAKMKDRAVDGASTALLDAIASGATGWIPYRGLVRSVSGASKHQKKVLKAYERGSHRRTFLKGIGAMQGCAYPAAPQPLPEDEPDVVFK